MPSVQNMRHPVIVGPQLNDAEAADWIAKSYLDTGKLSASSVVSRRQAGFAAGGEISLQAI
jgi:hypothetical protein